MIHWNASPVIANIGPISLRWYGLLFAGGFILAHRLAARYFIREKVSLGILDQLLLYIAAGTIIGARLGHTLFYEPDVYLRDPLRILMIWEGGLASHGAAIGILLAVYLFFRKNPQLRLLWILDRVAAPIAMAGVLIRLGNLFNSEILGKPSNVPWAFVFQRVDSIPRHPAMLYEAVAYLLIFFVLDRLYWRKESREAEGRIFGGFMAGIFGARFLLEFFKEVQVDFEAQLPLDMGQLLSIPFVALGVWMIVRSYRRPPVAEADPRRPSPSKK